MSDVNRQQPPDGGHRVCLACGTALAPIESRCHRCGTLVPLASAAAGPTVEVTWIGDAPRGGPQSLHRKPLLWVVGAAVVLGLIFGVVYVVSRDPVVPAAQATASVVPVSQTPSASPVTPPSVPVTPISPPSPKTQDRLPKSAPVPENEFIVPLGGQNEQRLRRANSRGSLLRKLHTPSGHSVNSPSLSADRRSLLYIDRSTDSVRTVAANGSKDRRLFGPPRGCRSVTHITWNPADQDRLVVRCLDTGHATRMLLCNLAGDVLKDVSPPHARYDDPAISPNGRSLVYWASDKKKLGGGSLYVVPIDGSRAERRLTRPGSMADADPVWSPDGSRIAFTRRLNTKNSNVYSVSVRGGKIRAVMTAPTIDQKPAWSPNGKDILVVSNRASSGRPVRRLSLYLAQASGDHFRRLRISAIDLSTPVWSYR